MRDLDELLPVAVVELLPVDLDLGSGDAQLIRSLGNGEDGAALEAQRVVDAVGLGDRAPARRVAVVGEGDRGEAVAVADRVRAEPGLRAGGRVLRLRRALAARLVHRACSAWISESCACARTGVPSARKSVYWTLRLSATALKVTVEPQMNVTIGGRPLFLPLPEPSAACASIILNSCAVTSLTSSFGVGRVEEQLQVQLPGLPAAELRGRQGDAGDRLDLPLVGLRDRVLLGVEPAVDRIAALDLEARLLESGEGWKRHVSRAASGPGGRSRGSRSRRSSTWR